VHAAAAAHTAAANERPRSEYALQACLGGKQLAMMRSPAALAARQGPTQTGARPAACTAAAPARPERAIYAWAQPLDAPAQRLPWTHLTATESRCSLACAPLELGP